MSFHFQSRFRLETVSQALNHDFAFREKATAVSDFLGFFHNLQPCRPNRVQDRPKITAFAFD
jgi:hypothetical protein